MGRNMISQILNVIGKKIAKKLWGVLEVVALKSSHTRQREELF